MTVYYRDVRALIDPEQSDPLPDGGRLQDVSVILTGPVCSLELAIVEWVGWFNNVRLHESLGDLPPAEFEGSGVHLSFSSTPASPAHT